MQITSVLIIEIPYAQTDVRKLKHFSIVILIYSVTKC